MGQEPGWLLSITDSTTTLRWDYDERRASAATPAAEPMAGGRRYRFSQGDTAFVVTVRDTLCADGMSGHQFPARVQVAIGARTLDGCGGAPAELLRGTTWRLDSMGGRAVLPEPPVSIAFGDDGRVTGSASCNRYFASYRVTSHALVVEPPGATRRACSPPIDAQEQAFLAALQGELTFELRNAESGVARTLVLEQAGGTRLVARRE